MATREPTIDSCDGYPLPLCSSLAYWEGLQEQMFLLYEHLRSTTLWPYLRLHFKAFRPRAKPSAVFLDDMYLQAIDVPRCLSIKIVSTKAALMSASIAQSLDELR